MPSVKDLGKIDDFKRFTPEECLQISKDISNRKVKAINEGSPELHDMADKLNEIFAWYRAQRVAFYNISLSQRLATFGALEKGCRLILDELGTTPQDSEFWHLGEAGVFATCDKFPSHIIDAVNELLGHAQSARLRTPETDDDRMPHRGDVVFDRLIDELGGVYYRQWGNVAPAINYGRPGHAIRFLQIMVERITGRAETGQFFKDRILKIKNGKSDIASLATPMTRDGRSRLTEG